MSILLTQNEDNRLDLISRMYDVVFRRNIESEEQFWKRLFTHKVEQWNTERVLDIDVFNSRVYYDLLFDDVVKYCDLANLEGLRILEAGCGTSVLSLLLAAQGARVYLVDRLEEAISYSRLIEEELRNRGPFLGRVDYRVDDIVPMSTDSQFSKSFDIVHNYGVLEECTPEESGELLKAMTTLSKDLIIVGVPNFFNPYLLQIWMKYGKTNERYFSQNSIRRQLESSGVSNVKSFTTSCLHPRLYKYKFAKTLGSSGFGFLHVAFGSVN